MVLCGLFGNCKYLMACTRNTAAALGTQTHLHNTRQEHVVLEGVSKSLWCLIELHEQVDLALSYRLPLGHGLWYNLQGTR